MRCIQLDDIHEFTPEILHRCAQSRKDLLGVDADGNTNRYRLIRCASKTPTALGVAHVDTVFSDTPSKTSPCKPNKYAIDDYAGYALGSGYSCDLDPAKIIEHGNIQSGALDDRLGVAILLDILPQVMPHFEYDILLTDDEEVGQSTAEDFTRYINDTKSNCPDELFDRVMEYQFLFQFDRAGSDVVMYNYYNLAAESLLEDAGWEIGRGAFTDICSMMDLGIWGANFGCGYHNQHSNHCYVDMDQLDINLRKFASFVRRVGDRQFADLIKPVYNKGWQPTYSGASKGIMGTAPKTVFKSNYPAVGSPILDSDDDDTDTENAFYASENQRAWSQEWDKYAGYEVLEEGLEVDDDDDIIDPSNVDLHITYEDDEMAVINGNIYLFDNPGDNDDDEDTIPYTDNPQDTPDSPKTPQ